MSVTEAGETEAPQALTPAHCVQPLRALFSLGRAMVEHELSMYCVSPATEDTKRTLQRIQGPFGWFLPSRVSRLKQLRYKTQFRIMFSKLIHTAHSRHAINTC